MGVGRSGAEPLACDRRGCPVDRRAIGGDGRQTHAGSGGYGARFAALMPYCRDLGAFIGWREAARRAAAVGDRSPCEFQWAATVVPLKIMGKGP